MPAIVRTEWSGTSGGPGLTQMAFSGGFNDSWDQAQTDAAVSAVRSFWGAIATYLPDELRLQVSPVVDVYDGIQGQLIASFSAGTAPSVVPGTGAGGYAGGAGLKVNWDTGTIAFGRRIKGHTYVVPVTLSAFTAVGTVGGAVVTAVNGAASAMLSAAETGNFPMVVWSRPKTLPAPRDGRQSLVISGTCGLKSAILRGRRD